MARELLFSVTKKDFEMQTFTVGGHGGAGKDTSNSGVRLIHRASNARAESRESRSVTQNRKTAFQRLVKTPEFLKWHKAECARHLGRKRLETQAEILARVDAMIESGLQDGTIKVEVVEVK